MTTTRATQAPSNNQARKMSNTGNTAAGNTASQRAPAGQPLSKRPVKQAGKKH